MKKHLAKFGYYQKELEQFRSKQPVSLRRIQVDPVSYCNHDCPFCIYRYDRNEDMNALFDVKDRLPFEKMIEIFEDCVVLGVQSVELTGGGEPSLHPQFPEILAALADRGLDIGLVTNGAWREKHFDAIVDGLSPATWVRFSLDSATSEVHRKTHAAGKNDFQTAIRAIEALVAHGTVDVGISFVVQQSNSHELEAGYRLAERLGVKYFRVGGIVFEGERIDHIELTPAEHARVGQELSDLKQDLSDVELIDNWTTRSLAEFPRYTEGDTCYYSHMAYTIGADGKVYPCCIWKYRPKGVIADLYEERLVDVWRRNAIDTFYEGFSIAEACTRCFLKDRNDLIHSFVTAEHINFG